MHAVVVLRLIVFAVSKEKLSCANTTFGTAAQSNTIARSTAANFLIFIIYPPFFAYSTQFLRQIISD